PLREVSATLLTIDGPMDVNQSATVLQIRVDISRPLVVPVTMLKEDYNVGPLELLCAWPTPGSRDFRVTRGGQQFAPDLLKCRIVVLSNSMILISSDKNNLNRSRRFRRRWRTGD